MEKTFFMTWTLHLPSQALGFAAPVSTTSSFQANAGKEQRFPQALYFRKMMMVSAHSAGYEG